MQIYTSAKKIVLFFFKKIPHYQFLNRSFSLFHRFIFTILHMFILKFFYIFKMSLQQKFGINAQFITVYLVNIILFKDGRTFKTFKTHNLLNVRPKNFEKLIKLREDNRKNRKKI